MEYLMNLKSVITDTKDKLVLFGIVSTPTKDLTGEEVLIHPKAFLTANKKYLSESSIYTLGDIAPIRVDHADPISPNYKKYGARSIGYALDLKYSPSDKPFDSIDFDWWFNNAKIEGVLCLTDPQAIEDYKLGNLGAVSLAWKHNPQKRLQVQSNQKKFIDHEIVIEEITMTNTPANPDAKGWVPVSDKERKYKNGDVVRVRNLKGIVKESYKNNAEILYDIDFGTNCKSLDYIPEAYINTKYTSTIQIKPYVRKKSIYTFTPFKTIIA